MSSPAIRLVECVAPQSDITKPSKPSNSFRSRCSVSGFSHDHLPLILLYEHMTEPTPASIAPANGG
eukprot:5974774-Prymnesium_polylepis.3